MRNIKIVVLLVVMMLIASLILVGCGGGGSSGPLGGALEGEWVAPGRHNPEDTTQISFNGANYTLSWTSSEWWESGGGNGPINGYIVYDTVSAPTLPTVGDVQRKDYLHPLGFGRVSVYGVIADVSDDNRVITHKEISGTFSITENRIEFLCEDGNVAGVADIQHTENTLTIGGVRFTRQ